MGVMPLIHIGLCASCEKMAMLEDHVCARCLRQLGREFARLVVRVRHEPEFALACYRRLGRKQQEAFLLWFGDPTLEVSPTELERLERKLERKQR